MIGKLQTNKVKFAVKLFDYIHSVDSEKLAQKIFDEQTKINRKIKIFIQVNIGEEDQKSGINKNELSKLIIFCKKINLEVVGLMCIPPANSDSEKYFTEMNLLNNEFKFKELSMGMSSDFIKDFDTKNIKKQDKQTVIIFRNYSFKKIDEFQILKIRNYCRKSRRIFILSNNILSFIFLNIVKNFY